MTLTLLTQIAKLTWVNWGSGNDGKRHLGFQKAPLQTFPDSSVMTHIHVDYLGPLPLTGRGNEHVVIFVDRFTKWVETRAVPDLTAVTMAKTFYDDCFL